MNHTAVDVITVLGTGCWIVCFWWMHRISSRQNALLDELRQQGQRIEKLSQAEHDLIKEIHPKVENIEGEINDVAKAVTGELPPRKDQSQAPSN